MRNIWRILGWIVIRVVLVDTDLCRPMVWIHLIYHTAHVAAKAAHSKQVSEEGNKNTYNNDAAKRQSVRNFTIWILIVEWQFQSRNRFQFLHLWLISHPPHDPTQAAAGKTCVHRHRDTSSFDTSLHRDAGGIRHLFWGLHLVRFECHQTWSDHLRTKLGHKFRYLQMARTPMTSHWTIIDRINLKIAEGVVVASWPWSVERLWKAG